MTRLDKWIETRHVLVLYFHDSFSQGWKWVDMACGEGLATAICQMDEA